MSYKRKNKYHYREEKKQQIIFQKEPLSVTPPTPVDIENEKCLENVLRSANKLRESPEEQETRELVLGELNEICQDWVRTSARSQKFPEEFISQSTCRLFAFGSYKLGVHSSGDDVDLLCVGPNFLNRDHFFDELGTTLQSNSAVRDYYAVRTAYVPVMTFEYNGIDIDMVYSQLQIDLIDKDWDINYDRNLRNLDSVSILSLNGVRLATKTLSLVPNKKVFKLSLRAIRYWAKSRAIYSNKIGYLGGVSWAILTARVCQLYPKANASMIVQNFFLFYHVWNFGHPCRAIVLSLIEQHDDMPNIKVWDPNEPNAKYEQMHIITPAFPAMNSTHNVSKSTFEQLKKEIARSFHLLSRAEKKITADKWRKLFEADTFFLDYKHYIFIKASSPSHILKEWSGRVESRVRSFVTSFEHYSDVKVVPYCRKIKYYCKKSDLLKYTHKDVLKENEIKRKKKLIKLKKLKLANLKKKKEAERLKQLQERLKRERLIEKEKLKAKIKQKEEELQRIADATADGDAVIVSIMDIDKNDNDQDIDMVNKENATDTGTGIVAVDVSDPIKNGVHKDTDGDISININIKQEKKIKITPDVAVGDVEIKKNVVVKKAKGKEDDDGVVMISNIIEEVPIENVAKPVSPSTKPVISNKKARKMKAKSMTPSVISSAVSIKQSNPYIYVAPDLQRKYGNRRYGRRNGYNRYRNGYNNYNRSYSSLNSSKITTKSMTNTPTPNKSPSLSSTSGSNNNNKDDKDKEKDNDNNNNKPNLPQINTITGGGQRGKFNVVRGNEIACCSKFSNKILCLSAEQHDYECNAFVVGLNVIKLQATYQDGTSHEIKQTFDFTQKVSIFLNYLNLFHQYGNRHVILELTKCTNVPHFLYKSNDYRRPSKDFIKKHQIQLQKNHELWKSKSCLATFKNDIQNQIKPTSSRSNTPKIRSRSRSRSLTPKSGSLTMSTTPTQKHLLFDSSIDVNSNNMPGLGLTPPANSNNNNDINTAIINPKHIATTNANGSRKRKAMDMDMNMNDNNGELPNKKRKLNDSPNTITPPPPLLQSDAGPPTQIIVVEQPQTRGQPPLQLPQKQIVKSLFKTVNFSERIDSSPTWDYAQKLYRNSQNYTSWSLLSHHITANATHIIHTCRDNLWKKKLLVILKNTKYKWNGVKYQIPLNKELMNDLAHDIGYNYIKHKQSKKLFKKKHRK